VVQEEATKLSKRAKRRVAGDEASVDTETEGPAESPEEPEPEAPSGAGAPAAEPAAPANRQARRTAASKARARRKRERAEASAIGLDAGEMMDDAFVRFTDKLGRLARRYWNLIQWVVGLGAITWLGYQVYSWRRAVVDAEVSDALFSAIRAEQGKIGDPEEEGKPNANGIVDPTRIFKDEAERAKAAAAAYEAAAALRPGSVAQGFALLGKAGLALESGKADEALGSYDEILAGKAVKASDELRGDALEGRGLSLETKGDLPGAFTAFETLAGVPGFENRALYQQARIKHAQGDTPAAKDLLNRLFKALGQPKAASLGGLPDRPDFLRERATQLATVIDPLEKDVKIPKPPLGADAVQQMLEQLKESGVVTPPAAPSP
jgi:tetratricopeptide (TPR) repeat protein